MSPAVAQNNPSPSLLSANINTQALLSRNLLGLLILMFSWTTFTINSRLAYNYAVTSSSEFDISSLHIRDSHDPSQSGVLEMYMQGKSGGSACVRGSARLCLLK
ncbi:MAG: hypothetical protein Q9204_004497 [Flavoplaca sp. TL-2023a]